MMEPLVIRAYEPSDQAAVLQLWRDCSLVVPQNDPKKDIARKLRVSPELFLVGLVEGVLVASVMVGYEGHRGAINYLAVSPGCRGMGYGRGMMEEAERMLRALGCAKINLDVRTTNLEVVRFYQSIGFVADDVVSLGKRLEFD